MKYEEALIGAYKGDLSKIPLRLLCLDPGETTGWCLFEQGYLTEYGQAPTVIQETVKEGKFMNWVAMDDIFVKTQPTVCVCENYRIYAHKLDRHSFSQVETLRLIGGIDYVCNFQLNIPLYYTMAVQAKGFVTDDRLKQWGFWKDGMKHSRDAIRHGIYHLIITNRPKGV